MDIGTAKASSAERERVPHHLIDVAEPDEPFTVADAQRIGRAALQSAVGPVIIAGGSGLAFRAIVDPLEFPGGDVEHRARLEALDLKALQEELLEVDPTAADHIDLANRRRIVRALEVHAVTGNSPTQRAATPEAAAVRNYEPLHPFRAIGFDPADGLAGRVTSRFDAMLKRGLLAEVGNLADHLGRTAGHAVGYKQLLPVLAGERSLEDGRQDALAATMAVARNQRTYFRRDPRITWLEWDDDPQVRLGRARRELAI